MIDAHDLLGVHREATPQETAIGARHAFHRLARIVHPDVGGTAADLHVIAEAYEALTGEKAPPSELTLRALCASLLGVEYAPTMEHDVVCHRLFALGDAPLEPTFDVVAFVADELALLMRPEPKAEEATEPKAKRARLDRLDVGSHYEKTQDERIQNREALEGPGKTMDERYGAMLVEREREVRAEPLLDARYVAALATEHEEQVTLAKTLDERYAAMVAERAQLPLSYEKKEGMSFSQIPLV